MPLLLYVVVDPALVEQLSITTAVTVSCLPAAAMEVATPNHKKATTPAQQPAPATPTTKVRLSHYY